MSRSTTENIECPHCHKVGEFELWATVDGVLNPELREKIFTGELFMYIEAVDKFCVFCEATIPKRAEQIISVLKTVI